MSNVLRNGSAVASLMLLCSPAAALSGVDRPAGAERLRLAGTDTEIVWWEDDGDHGYLVEVDGEVMRRVDDAPVELRLRYATFDPLDGPPIVPDGLVIDDPGEGQQTWIVQFVTQPLEAYREDIRARGGTIHKFLAHNAYIVRMDPAARAAVEDLPYVRWIGPYQPAYRLEEELLAALRDGPEALPATRVNIQVFERGLPQKTTVARRVEAIGGVVNRLTPGGFVFEATLDGRQLLDVVAMPEVQFIDRWSPPETDMNLAREIGGANHIETVAGFTGQGVRGEVFDTNLFDSHVDFQNNPPIFHGSRSGSDDHGTATYGITFGDGTGDDAGRGMLPDGQGIFADFEFLTDRHAHTADLVESPFFAVFQSNSWGNQRTTDYTSISAEMDDVILLNDIVITQSQSNANSRNSRPQAWAKNIVAVGGVNHRNTESRDDDFWGGASIGPADDGRIKPDLVHFYDSIFTTDDRQNGYRDFCCTSGATPIVAGHFGLFFQMWSEGVFGNEVDQNGSVFDNRSHAATARAMVINSAFSYPFSGTGHNLTRVHQGWGMPDLARLYDQRGSIFVVDEEVVLENLDAAVYELTVESGTPEFRATMVYADPAGTTSSNLHRINDVSLKVTGPGGTVYWGNNGLHSGNWSTAGGAANTVDTVENVFVQNPAGGVWTVEVIASEVNEDAHIETPEVDVDFALVVSGVVPQAGDVLLNGFDIVIGSLLDGDLASITESDDDYLHTRSGFGETFVDLHNLTLDIHASTTVDSPSTLDVAIESRIDEPTGSARVSLRNWSTGAFETVGTYSIGTTEEVVVIEDIDASQYVSGDGSIDLRLRHVVFVPFIAFTFESFIDEVGIAVE